MPTTVTPFASNDAPQSDGQASTFRTPPHNVEAEKALLGAIFANNRAHEKVSEFLRPEHFSIAEHGRIFEAVTTLVEKGQIADVVTLQRYFEQEDRKSVV